MKAAAGLVNALRRRQLISQVNALDLSPFRFNATTVGMVSSCLDNSNIIIRADRSSPDGAAAVKIDQV